MVTEEEKIQIRKDVCTEIIAECERRMQALRDGQEPPKARHTYFLGKGEKELTLLETLKDVVTRVKEK